jgi:hypothetical protein
MSRSGRRMYLPRVGLRRISSLLFGLLVAACGGKEQPLGTSISAHDAGDHPEPTDRSDAPDEPPFVGVLDAASDAPQCTPSNRPYCNLKGRRETCGADGTWHETDYVCTVDVVIDDQTGSYCATKADGRYKCWGSLPAASLPEAKYVRVQLMPDGLVGVTDDGHVYSTSLTIPADLPLAEGLRATNMFGHQALCFRSKTDGSFVMYSESVIQGPVIRVLDPGPFVDTRCAYEGIACGVKTDGTMWCNNSNVNTLPGNTWSEVALSWRYLCARTRTFDVTCTSTMGNNDATIFQPVKYEHTAVTLAVVCALDRRGQIGCYRGDTYLPVDPGPYKFIDAGRNVVCAIRTDGTTACWQHATVDIGSNIEVKGFVPVSPPIDADW